MSIRNLAGLLVLGLGVAFAAPAATAANATTAGWQTLEQYAASAPSAVGIACQSTSACYAVESTLSEGGIIQRTTDGGATWTSEPLAGDISYLHAIACTATACFAVGENSAFTGVILMAVNGGSWVAQTVPPGTQNLNSVTCPGATTCFAAGGGTVVATTNGTAWSTQTIPGDSPGLNSVTCASTTECFASGQGANIVGTLNGGSNWSDETVADSGNVGELLGVACGSTSDCWAVGQDNTLTDGVIWATTDATDAKSTWSAQTAPALVNIYTAVACDGISTCYAVGTAKANDAGPATISFWGGTSWGSQTPPDGSATLAAVTCPSTTQCLAAGTGTSGYAVAYITTDTASWSAQTLQPGVDSLTGVTCPDTSDCYAVGSSSGGFTGAIFASSDGGHTWAPQTIPGSILVTSIACLSVSTCFAAGEDSETDYGAVIGTTDGGTTWAAETVSQSFDAGEFTGIACSSASDCWAVGENSSFDAGVIWATTDGTDLPSTWASQGVPASPSATSVLNSISCVPETTTCWAVGKYAGSPTSLPILNTTDGTTWTEQTGPAGVTGVLSAISCASASVCFATGQSNSTGILVTTGDGGATAWTSQAVPADFTDPQGITCFSTTACYAVGSGGTPTAGSIITTADGGSSAWTDMTVPSGPAVLSSISCMSETSCIAVGTGSSPVGGMILGIGLTDPPTQLVFTTQPGGGQVGAAWSQQPTVAIEDATNSIVTADDSPIVLSIVSGTGKPGATLSDCTAPTQNGVATFSGCRINEVGTGYQLVATDTADEMGKLSATFTITTGPPTQLVFTTQPGGGQVGAAWSKQPTVAIEDATNSIVTADDSPIVLSIVSGTGKPGATLSHCTAPTQNGVATFSGCRINKVGTGYQLVATDTADEMRKLSATFTITTGPAHKLVFTKQPGRGKAKKALSRSPRVAIEDASGNVVTSDIHTITLRIERGTGHRGARLSHCTAKTAHGIAQFKGCKISKPGHGYKLTATDAKDKLHSTSVRFTIT